MCVVNACPLQCYSCYSKSCKCEWIDARGVGRQAGTRKATTRPHVKLSWPHLAGGGRTQDSWLRLCQPPARAGGEDGVPQARNRASPHQRPALTLPSGLSLAGELTTLKLPTPAQHCYIEQSRTLDLFLLRRKVGGGVVGAAIAREFAASGKRVLLCEKEDEVTLISPVKKS